MRNRTRRLKIALAKLALAAAATAMMAGAPRAAHAGEEFYIAADWPIRLVDRPLVLGPSMFELRGDTLRLELSKDSVGDPISLAPDLYYGLTDRITLGYVHDVGICISGDGCATTYADFGVEALFSLIYEGPLVMAGRIGMTFGPLDPFTGGIHAGLPVRVGAGDLAVLVEPRVYIGLLERDTRGDFVEVPVQLQYQLTDQNVLLLSSGVRGPLSDFGDAVAVPVGVGALATLSRRVDVGGELLFTNLAGRGGGIDGRLLLLRVALRL
jgi:hypothetical protein